MLTFRPHHFLCTLCFQGKGYSPNFIRNYKKIVNNLTGPGGDRTPIQVVAITDAICAPCPNKQGLLCKTQEKIEQLDLAHSKALQLQAGDELTWDEAKQKIKQHITLPVFHNICAPCSWKQYGLCEAVLKDFLPD
jgi:uncharacterized protein